MISRNFTRPRSFPKYIIKKTKVIRNLLICWVLEYHSRQKKSRFDRMLRSGDMLGRRAPSRLAGWKWWYKIESNQTITDPFWRLLPEIYILLFKARDYRTIFSIVCDFSYRYRAAHFCISNFIFPCHLEVKNVLRHVHTSVRVVQHPEFRFYISKKSTWDLRWQTPIFSDWTSCVGIDALEVRDDSISTPGCS